ncbi:hypothetical protein BGZ73_000449 [Actinomortierella ambigua]|nr:hypothetical protein BGZ73_000449 [Actinomortierella ambigua]
MSFEDLERLMVGSVPDACLNLTNHLGKCFDSDTHAKAFYEFLPKLCRILFGSKESRGWLHLPLQKYEMNSLHDLLAPQGIMMRFMLAKFTDPIFYYEMQPGHLPKRTQSKLDPALYHQLPQMYLTRVHLEKVRPALEAQKTGNILSRVVLTFNMLEFYLYYFAYAFTLDDDELNLRSNLRPDPKLPFVRRVPPPAPSQSTSGKRTAAAVAPPRILVEGVYYELFNLYIRYFLPAPLPSNVKDSPAGTKMRVAPSLNVFTDETMEAGPDRHSSQMSISEFFVGTIAELWLGQNGGRGSGMVVDNQVVRYIQPSEEMAQCICVLVSHLFSHDVSGYALGGEKMQTHVVDSQGQSVLNLPGMARRNAYQCLRPELYTFLKLGMKFWPLNETFPAFVSVWTMWITPWRYGKRDPPLNEGDIVSAKWQPFVLDNILFYSHMLELYLGRLSQPTPSNRTVIGGPAPMTLTRELRSIQRVLKIYQAKNLTDIIKIGEKLILSPENFTESSYLAFERSLEAPTTMGNVRSTAVAQDATSQFLSNMALALQKQLLQLEGREFRFEGLFLVEGTGRVVLRSILTKLGHLVDIRQERLNAIEAAAASSANAASSAGWNVLNTLGSLMMMSTPPAKSSTQDPAILKRDIKSLRDTMKLVGQVFDLVDAVVASFEKQHHVYLDGAGGDPKGGVNLTPEQLELLQLPLEDEQDVQSLLDDGYGGASVSSSSQFSSSRSSGGIKGLVRRNVEDIKGQGPRAEELVLSYEIGFLVEHTRTLEQRLTPYWQWSLRRLRGALPFLPASIEQSRVRLRWLASVRNLVMIAMVVLAYMTLRVMGSYWNSLVHGGMDLEGGVGANGRQSAAGAGRHGAGGAGRGRQQAYVRPGAQQGNYMQTAAPKIDFHVTPVGHRAADHGAAFGWEPPNFSSSGVRHRPTGASPPHAAYTVQVPPM